MIAFVILHYKVIEETRKCIDSILALDGTEKKIVIVDNRSDNGTGILLQDEYHSNPYVSVLLLDKNIGFAKGNNYGYAYAVKEFKPDFIVVLNNDVIINQKDFIRLVSKIYQETQFDILGPDIYSTSRKVHQNPDQDIQPTLSDLKKWYTIARLKNRFRFLFYIKHCIDFYLKPIRKLHTSRLTPEHNFEDESATLVHERQIGVPLQGACYIFSSAFISEHSVCFYDKTFMYMEAQILYYQSMRDNLKLVYDPILVVEHHEKSATNSICKTSYQKSVFINKNLVDSYREFIKLKENDERFDKKQQKD